MDVDMMRSSPSSSSDQEHMDMVTMMMHMEKLPDFYDHQPNYQITPTTTTTTTASSPTYTLSQTAPTSLPFMGTPVQEPRLKYAPFHLPPQQQQHHHQGGGGGAYCLSSMEKKNSTAAIREMIFRIAAMQPIHIDPEAVKPPKRRNVRISKDPQSVAARHRRERISERIRILQRLVPGGTKMDTASMLDEAIHYVKFLKKQVQSLEQAGGGGGSSNGIGRVSGLMGGGGGRFGLSSSGVAVPASLGYFSLGKINCQSASVSMVGSNSMQMLR